MVWKLHMRLNQKMAITILIGFGLITTGLSVGRVLHYATTKFAEDQTCTFPRCITTYLPALMCLGSGIQLVIWTTLEANVGITAANLPALGFLRRKIEDKLASISVPALRYLHILPLRTSEKSEGREMLPTFGAGKPRKHHSLDSVLRSNAEINTASTSEDQPTNE
jgi:hypothetical protein